MRGCADDGFKARLMVARQSLRRYRRPGGRMAWTPPSPFCCSIPAELGKPARAKGGACEPVRNKGDACALLGRNQHGFRIVEISGPAGWIVCRFPSLISASRAKPRGPVKDKQACFIRSEGVERSPVRCQIARRGHKNIAIGGDSAGSQRAIAKHSDPDCNVKSFNDDIHEAVGKACIDADSEDDGEGMREAEAQSTADRTSQATTLSKDPEGLLRHRWLRGSHLRVPQVVRFHDVFEAISSWKAEGKIALEMGL